MTETVPLEIAASIVGNVRFLIRNNNYFVTLSRKSHVKEGVLREGHSNLARKLEFTPAEGNIRASRASGRKEML